MKIGFDVSMLVYQGSGVATYTYNLVKALLTYDKQNEYHLFYSSFRRPAHFYYLEELKKLGGKIYDYPFPPRFLKFCWNKHHLLPVEWLIGKVDIFHSSDFLHPPLFKSTKGITTIHDLTWKMYPEFHTQDVVTAHKRKLTKTIKYHDHIIVDSENTKKDLLKYYPGIQTTNRVSVIYPGIDNRFQPVNDSKKIKTVLKKYGVDYPKNYLLYVGAIEPRKNLQTAVKVFADLIQDKRYADFEFLFVGRAGWKNEEVFSLIDRLRLKKKIKLVGYVEDDDLLYFYNAARTLMYLSLYEGFGLPPLEAAKCGTPVMIYRNSSLGEIFPADYPFIIKNNELVCLKKLLTVDAFRYLKLLDKFNWLHTAAQFTAIF